MKRMLLVMLLAATVTVPLILWLVPPWYAALAIGIAAGALMEAAC
ncbi:hypothetical protein VLK31_34860 [Variovorax sp. H27-G14]